MLVVVAICLWPCRDVEKLNLVQVLFEVLVVRYFFFCLLLSFFISDIFCLLVPSYFFFLFIVRVPFVLTGPSEQLRESHGPAARPHLQLSPLTRKPTSRNSFEQGQSLSFSHLLIISVPSNVCPLAVLFHSSITLSVLFQYSLSTLFSLKKIF